MNGPIPTRVNGAVKAALLALVEDAVAAGWPLSRICGLLEIDRARAWRWKTRQLAGRLDDGLPGGNPIHGLLGWEEAEILVLFDEWGPVDLSHRKLAHRGSYLERVFVSPSSVDRVLARHGLALPGTPRPARSTKRPWPDWVQWRPNQLWCWDATHFMRCVGSPVVYGIVDVVSRKWVATLLTPEATSTQVKVLFLAALDAEGLLDGLEWRLDRPDDVDLAEEAAPILLAVSDNGPEMRSDETRAFMALVTIGQHFGRPSTPTDQAWTWDAVGPRQSREPPPGCHHRTRRPRRGARPGPPPLQLDPPARGHRLRHPQRRTRRPRRQDPRRPPRRPRGRRRSPSRPASSRPEREAMNRTRKRALRSPPSDETMLGGTTGAGNPALTDPSPTPLTCGLKHSQTCRAKSETPHTLLPDQPTDFGVPSRRTVVSRI